MVDWALITQDMQQAPTDKQMCELVDRLRGMGYRHTLETELRLAKFGGGYGFTTFLPEFREKGIMTITKGERPVLYSTRNHH